MEDMYDIPLFYQKGIYPVQEFDENDASDEVICLENDTQYRILSYWVPTLEGWQQIRLFGDIGHDFIDMDTLRAFYDAQGQLQKITADIDHQEALLYIHFADAEHARQEIRDFAVRNADQIIEKIAGFEDVAARLFIEYCNDSEGMDFHALLATPAQKEAVEPVYDDSADNPGNYPGDFLYGDNDAFCVLINCARDGETDFFQYAVDIMVERIREQALDRLRKSEDFRFICSEYD